ncbi:MAG: hypothetical protein M1813_002736 [Trichoglossum hirsutum]|nr:MAG: hypothetical protein M1813_002736 [Trichoglossum hirsutum]
MKARLESPSLFSDIYAFIQFDYNNLLNGLHRRIVDEVTHSVEKLGDDARELKSKRVGAADRKSVEWLVHSAWQKMECVKKDVEQAKSED